jgi:hypothetical protein
MKSYYKTILKNPVQYPPDSVFIPATYSIKDVIPKKTCAQLYLQLTFQLKTAIKITLYRAMDSRFG